MAPAVAAVLLAAATWTTAAGASGYTPGYYIGRTSQGHAISFVVAGGKVSELFTQVVDSCRPGVWYDTLYPHPAPIGASGSWSHFVPGSQPTIFHGQVSGSTATGTIADTIDNSAGRACTSQVTYRATRSTPMQISSATVGGAGVEVVLRLAAPSSTSSGSREPYTSTGLLVYASTGSCPATYAAADSLARSQGANGLSGLISDAYVDESWSSASVRGQSGGVFTFDVNTNTIFHSTGPSPFSTVCAMLYSGTPATLHPSANVALATVTHALVPGAGPPNRQP